jgi:HemY protein
LKRLAPALLLAILVTLAGAGLAALYGRSGAGAGPGGGPGVAVAAMLVAAITSVMLASLAWLTQAPARRAHERGDARRRARHEAISRGFMALGAGDPGAARRWVQSAEGGGEPVHPLSRLLAAWAAEAEGDTAAATAAYESLLDHPDARLAARRGLMLLARARGDEAGALAQAEAAYGDPAAPGWAWRLLFDALRRRGESAAAVALVEDGAARGVYSASAAVRLRTLAGTAADASAIEHALSARG